MPSASLHENTAKGLINRGVKWSNAPILDYGRFSPPKLQNSHARKLGYERDKESAFHGKGKRKITLIGESAACSRRSPTRGIRDS